MILCGGMQYPMCDGITEDQPSEYGNGGNICMALMELQETRGSFDTSCFVALFFLSSLVASLHCTCAPVGVEES